jgi:hypothetical protein
MHDLAAELQGYKNELKQAEQRGNKERAAAVREEIKRVGAAVREKAEALEAAAHAHDAAGQDVLAAQARVEARRYRDLLPKRGRPAKGKDDGAQTGSTTSTENTADSTPTETA